MRLYSTLAARPRRAAGAARSDRHVRLRPHRLCRAPTSATRAPSCSRCWYKRWLRERGYEVTLVHNITDVNDKIYEAAPGRERRARRQATEWYLEDTGRFGLDEVDLWPKVTETMDEIVAFIVELVERGYAYEVSGDVYFRVSRFQEYGRLSGQRPDQLEDEGAEPAQGGSARLRALEGEQAGGGHGVGLALGTRAAGLAHRVLGHGGEAARARVRDPRRGARPRLPAPRERVRAVARRAATSSRGSGCTTACFASPARRCRSRSATSRRSREVLDRWGRETLLLFFLTAHWRSPIDFSDETHGRRRRLGRTACARCSATRPSRPRRTPGSASQAVLDDDFNTPAALALHARVARSRPAAARARRLRPRRARRAGRGPGGGARPRAGAPGSPRREGLRRGRPAARADRSRGLGCARRLRRLPARPAGSDAGAVYGRRPVREALRGRRQVLELWATERASPPSRGWRRAARPDQAGAGDQRGRRHARPSGRARLDGAVPLRRRATSSRRRRAAARLPRPGHRSRAISAP